MAILTEWEKLPPFMKTPEVRKYYDILSGKRVSLGAKRCFDVALSGLLLLCLLPLFIVIAVAVKLDTPGPVFFRQERVTRYGRRFRIFKFRTMTADAPGRGPSVTVRGDSRVTRTGRLLRSLKLDELPQLIDVFRGTMTFVGTRPEVPRYVAEYTPEMYATLLLPAGITSRASIEYREESELLCSADDADKTYISTVLPAKMKYNLGQLRGFSLWDDIRTIFMTAAALFGYSRRGSGDQDGSSRKTEATTTDKGGDFLK